MGYSVRNYVWMGEYRSVCVCVCVCEPARLGVGGLERPERTREHNAWEDNRGKNVKKKIKSLLNLLNS